MSITAVIHALNEAHQIDRCLRSLAWVDRIFFIDTFSSDDTAEIARRYTDDVVQREYVNAATTKNWALENAPASDWLMFVDADEVIPEDLATEIQAAVKDETVDGLELNILTYIGDRPSRSPHWNPNHQVRLFRRGKARWEDKEVHAKLQLDGTTRRLASPLHHFPYGSVDALLIKLNRYTTFESRQRIRDGATLTDGDFPALSFLRSVRLFIRLYVERKGYLDGRMGLIVSVVASLYVFFTDAKHWERTHLSAGPHAGEEPSS